MNWSRLIVVVHGERFFFFIYDEGRGSEKVMMRIFLERRVLSLLSLLFLFLISHILVFPIFRITLSQILKFFGVEISKKMFSR